jgi:valyl-tRNA synthetase
MIVCGIAPLVITVYFIIYFTQFRNKKFLQRFSSVIEELNYTKGFLQSVLKKLENEKFVAGAPEQVLIMERKKESDALSKIKILEEKLASMASV